MAVTDDCVTTMKALGDKTRLMILEMLTGGELCACKIQERFDFTQPTLSYHMKILTESGLVTGVRSGAWMRYSLNHDTLGICRDFLAGLSEPVAVREACR